MTSRWRAAGCGALLIVGAAMMSWGEATAQLGEYTGGPEPPDLVELTGHVGEAADGETGGWEITLGAGLSPTVYHFHLNGMRILNSGRLPLSVLSSLEPYRPTFFIFGSPEQMRQLAAATPADPLLILGYRRRGSRNLMVSELRLTSPQTPAPSPLGIE